MQFQILNSEHQPLTMGQLDKEAATFFGVELKADKYASPKNIPYFDWFNWVGQSIANLSKGDHEWSEVIGDLCRIQAISFQSVDELIGDIDVLRPHLELIAIWAKKGYIPRSL